MSKIYDAIRDELPMGWRLYTMDASIFGRVSVMVEGPQRFFEAGSIEGIDYDHYGAEFLYATGATTDDALVAVRKKIAERSK